MRTRKCSLRLTIVAAAIVTLLAGEETARPVYGAGETLTWLSPRPTAEVRVGRRPLGAQGGAVNVDGGEVAKFCTGTVSLPEGSLLSCKLSTADASYEYVVCMKAQNRENLGGFECSYHGSGGGWECAPVDIAASWCD